MGTLEPLPLVESLRRVDDLFSQEMDNVTHVIQHARKNDSVLFLDFWTKVCFDATKYFESYNTVYVNFRLKHADTDGFVKLFEPTTSEVMDLNAIASDYYFPSRMLDCEKLGYSSLRFYICYTDQPAGKLSHCEKSFPYSNKKHINVEVTIPKNGYETCKKTCHGTLCDNCFDVCMNLSETAKTTFITELECLYSKILSNKIPFPFDHDFAAKFFSWYFCRMIARTEKESMLLCVPFEYSTKVLGRSLVLLNGDLYSPDNESWDIISQHIVSKLHAIFSDVSRYENLLHSALAAVMSRNMSHNIGSHVLVRLAQESLSGNVDYGRDAADPGKKNDFDPMKLVIEDAYDALEEASKPEKGILATDSFLRHRIGAAIHYLEAVHDQVDPNVKPGKTRQEALAQDTRVLASYVQQRMDFIAQICTDWSKWTTASCLCHDVMALFFQQSKILEHIAASDNLTAARFGHDGKLLPKPTKVVKNDKGEEVKEDDKVKTEVCAGRIKFVVRYQAPNKNFTEVINYEGARDERGEIKKDKHGNAKLYDPSIRIPISFPGGRIGWQAFYIIIEGVIRNFAKHSYSDYIKKFLDKKKSENKKVKNEDKFPDLEIVIDVIDDGESKIAVKSDDRNKSIEKPAYTVRVYSNVSIDENQKVSSVLQKNLQTSFIRDNGELSKENWGLAEIRAAVGYLQQAEIMDIGDKDQKIVSVNHCEESSPLLRKFDVTKPRFYYEFKILKPQIIGIETSDELVKELENEAQNKKTDNSDRSFIDLRKDEGWEVFSSNNVRHRSFDYYVVDGRDGSGSDFGKALVELLKESGNLSNKEFKDYPSENEVFKELVKYPGRLFVIRSGKDKLILRNSDKQIKQLLRVCVLETGDYKQLRNVCFPKMEVGGTDDAALFLQKKWLEHWLRYRTGKEDKNEKVGLSLYHYLNESDASGGEGYYMPDTTPFQPSKEDIEGKSTGKEKKEESTTRVAKNPIELNFDGTGAKESYSLVFGRHFGLLERDDEHVKERSSGRSSGRATGKPLYAESMSGGSSYLSIAQNAFEKGGKEIITRDLLSLAEAALMRVVIIDERVQEQFIKADVKTMVSIAEQQVFVGYLRDMDVEQCNDSEPIAPKEIDHAFSQKYPREDSSITKTGYVTVTVENEEKETEKQIKEEQDKKEQIKIDVMLDRTLVCGEDNASEYLWVNSGKEQIRPDILIIHQGILDKWVKLCKINPTADDLAQIKKDDLTESNPETKAKTALLIKALKKRIPFVVITSGRGKPREVPKGCSFLPLSSFDAGPRSCMYEKFPLVQQVLSIVEQE